MTAQPTPAGDQSVVEHRTRGYIFGATGRRGCIASIYVRIHNNEILAFAAVERMTEKMLGRALAKEFPYHTFYIRTEGNNFVAQADRWTGDGVKDGAHQ